MNYNPNYYTGYPYNYNGNNNQYLYNNVAPQNNIPQINSQITTPMLNGKIVDSEDVVKATEVPIGGYGVFPKADFSEIYLKTWNNNGTINIVKFHPVIEQPEPKKEEISNDNFSELMQKIDSINNKIDSIFTSSNTTKKKVEAKISGF